MLAILQRQEALGDRTLLKKPRGVSWKCREREFFFKKLTHLGFVFFLVLLVELDSAKGVIFEPSYVLRAD